MRKHGEILRLRRIVFLNILTLIAAMSLFVGAYIIAALQFEFTYYWSVIIVGCMMLLLGLVFLIFVTRIFFLNMSFIRNNKGNSLKRMMFGVYIPLIMTVLFFIGSPIIYVRTEHFSRIRKIRQETPLTRAIADVCANLFRDPNYIMQIPESQGSYKQVGDNDYVLIWSDITGDAYWYDTADSLSSHGYVCIRPGIPIQDAVTDYESWKPQRDFINIHDGLYWWNR